MKVCVIQPEYKIGFEYVDECFEKMCTLLDSCQKGLDLIVLPEYCDVPAACKSAAEYAECRKRYGARILQKAKDAAIRCNAVVFVNCSHYTGKGYRNTTHAINRQGEVVGRYYKKHPTMGERKPNSQGGMYDMDCEYLSEQKEPYTVTIDGIKYGFLTCYDFYFYEDFADIARQKVDILIGCSHQRSDTHQALEIINRFLCYNTNAYLVRSSVSLGEDSSIGGGSCIVAPDGKVLVDMKSKIGVAFFEIDPKDKYFKSAGFRGAPMPHWQYVDIGRGLPV